MADIIIEAGDIFTLDDNDNRSAVFYNVFGNEPESKLSGNATKLCENGTRTCNNVTSQNIADAEWDKGMRILVLWIQIILGFIGGFAVCIWLWCNRRRKSRVNVIMLHVTVSDLLVIVTTLIQVIWEMADRWWLVGDAMCRIVKFYQSFSMMASSYMLVLLSIDRHQAILSPLRNPTTVWKVALPFWLAAAILSTPMFFLFYVTYMKDEKSIFFNKVICESVFRHRPKIDRQVFLTSMSIFHVFVPCVIITVCYVRIFLKIAQKAKEANPGKMVLKPGKIYLQSTKSTSLPKAKVKTLKMTLVIVSMFILCGLPYHILEMMYNFWSHVKVPKIVSAVLGALPVANSVINPYIFLAFNTNCQSVKYALGCRNRSEYMDSKSNSLACTTKTTINIRYSDYQSTAIELTKAKNMTGKDIDPAVLL